MITLDKLTDAQLVTIYQSKADSIYFGELYNRYFIKVYHYCLGKVKDRDDAYDITADTFVKLTTKLTQLRNPELFIAWLFKITNNACMDKLRSHQFTQSVNEYYLNNIQDTNNDIAEVQLKEAQLDQLDQAISKLDEETKVLLIERYFKKKKIEALSKEFGLTESAVKMRLTRARRKIAKHYKSVTVGA